MFPAFRPDNALRVNQPERFKKWVKALGNASGTSAGTFKGFLKSLKQRHDFFHANGCRLSDHGLERMPSLDCSEKKAAAIFSAALKGRAASPEDAGPVCVVSDGIFWRARCRKRLGQTTSPRRVARPEFANRRQTRRGHRLRYHRRFHAGKLPGALPGSSRPHRQTAQNDPL